MAKPSLKSQNVPPFHIHIEQFVSNENKCLLISRFKVYAIFVNASRLSRATLCCIVWAPVPQPPNPTATLADWLANGDDCEVHLCAESQSGGDQKKRRRRRRRQKRGHSTATKRLACHPVLGQSAARQVLSKQLSSSSSGSRCHKCCKLAMPLQTLQPYLTPHSPLPWPFRQLPQSV